MWREGLDWLYHNCFPAYLVAVFSPVWLCGVLAWLLLRAMQRRS